MFSDLSVFRLAGAMATHAGQRQAVIARNMANADTPGYRARDVTRFADLIGPEGTNQMRTTRAGHVGVLSDGSAPPREEEIRSERDPNGNSVTLETEMMKAADVSRQHDRALAIYRSGMNVLRASLRQN